MFTSPVRTTGRASVDKCSRMFVSSVKNCDETACDLGRQTSSTTHGASRDVIRAQRCSKVHGDRSHRTATTMLEGATMATPPWFVKPMLSSLALVGNGRVRLTTGGLRNVASWWGQHRRPRAMSPSGTIRLCRCRHATVWRCQLCCLSTAHWVCRTWDGAVVRRHDVRCVPGAGWTYREMMKRRPRDAKIVMCHVF